MPKHPVTGGWTRGNPVTTDDKRMWASMYERGHTYREIARRTEKPSGTVAVHIGRMLAAGDLKPRSPDYKPRPGLQNLLRMTRNF